MSGTLLFSGTLQTRPNAGGGLGRADCRSGSLSLSWIELPRGRVAGTRGISKTVRVAGYWWVARGELGTSLELLGGDGFLEKRLLFGMLW